MSLRSPFLKNVRIRPGMVLGAIMLVALAAFETFNYSTTQYALSDLLGSLSSVGVPWATILSIAFCGIDFAGIARLFTPDQDHTEPSEAWYLFGAWLLAATMNAILTWWGVSMAVVNHSMQSTSIIPASIINQVVPVFVAIMVWVIRILIIGSISVSIDRYLNHDRYSLPRRSQSTVYPAARQPLNQPASIAARPSVLGPRNIVSRPNNDEDETPSRIEPTYHSTAVTASPVSGLKAPIGEPDNHWPKLG